MTDYKSLARGVVYGTPYDPNKKPSRSAFVSMFENLDEDLEGAAEGLVGPMETWAALNAIAGTRAGQPGEVDAADTGTHTDPVVGGTVPNSGRFRWVATSPSGWKRVGDLIDRVDRVEFADGTYMESSTTDADQRMTDTAVDVWKVQDGDHHVAFAGPSAQYGWLAELDRANVARAHSIQNQPHGAKINPLTKTEQIFLGDGQSLQFAQQAWAPFSGWNRHASTDFNNWTPDDPYPNTYMMSGSVRGYGTSYTLVGSLAFNALVATVEAVGASSVVLTAAEIADLVEPDAAYGESPIVGLVRGVARAWDQKGYLPSRKWTAAVTAAPGQPWDTLAKGQPLYNRNVVCVNTDFKALALARSGAGNSAVAGVWLLGGQYNYSTADFGGTEDEAGCTALLDQRYIDLNGDINTWLTQPLPPPWYINVPDGQYTRDDGLMGIANASLKFAYQHKGVWCLGGHAWAHDKAGHLDGNGSRELSEKAIQVYRHTVFDGKDWLPTHPIWMLELNDILYVGFHAPALPLQFKTPTSAANLFHGYGEITPQLQSSKGFTLIDATGTMPLLTDPYISGASILVFEMARPRNGTMHLWAGRYLSLHEGMTMLCDSDGAGANENYLFVDPPMQAEQNITELVDKPYSLENWCFPFRHECPTTVGEQMWIDYLS